MQNSMKSLTRLCIRLNYCKRELNHKTGIKLIQLQIEIVTPSDWAHGLQKILLRKTQYTKMIKTLESFINSITDKSFTMDCCTKCQQLRDPNVG